MPRNKNASVTEMASHVEELAFRFKIQIVRIDRMEDSQAALEAWQAEGKVIEARAVMLVPVTDECSYAVALHELGHQIHPTGMVALGDKAEQLRLALLMERSAWEWAYEHALIWTAAMEHMKQQGMQSHEHAAQLRATRAYIEASLKARAARADKVRTPEHYKKFARRILS